MKSYRFFFNIVFLFCILFFQSCEDNPTEPIQEPIQRDTEKPNVTILYPLTGSKLKLDTSYTIIANAEDNISISKVEFYIDGKIFDTIETVPYESLWSTQGKSSYHTVMIKAFDGSGNIGQSAVVTIKVNTSPGTASNPDPIHNATGSTISPTLNWTCSDIDGDTLTYDVYFDTSNPPTTLVASDYTMASLTRSGLSQYTTYYWKVITKDSKGPATTGQVWSFTTGSDVIFPGTVLVSAGTFTAGSTLVTINDFKIDMYEVTYELWTDVRAWALMHGYTDMAAGQNGYNPIGSNHPVTKVSWYDAVKWCNARSEKDGLTPVYYTDSRQITIYHVGDFNINIDAINWNANGYRLPTETEWEYAARGGTNSHGNIYSGSDIEDSVAWAYNKSGYMTHSVGTKSANELGIYDMSGNVSEWCWDWYYAYYTYMDYYPYGGSICPKGPSATQTYRIKRGGGFHLSSGSCRVDARNYHYPYVRYEFIGFRCLRN